MGRNKHKKHGNHGKSYVIASNQGSWWQYLSNAKNCRHKGDEEIEGLYPIAYADVGRIARDVDVLIALDSDITKLLIQELWVPGDKPEVILVDILDGRTPSYQTMDRLVELMAKHIKLGHKISFGCYGGHGRTGLVLGCYVGKILNKPNPVKWVRDNYCELAIETRTQSDFVNAFCGLLTDEQESEMQMDMRQRCPVCYSPMEYADCCVECGHVPWEYRT